jgi:hypothetical protein
LTPIPKIERKEMSVFTDSAGRDWNIKLTLGTARKVFLETDIDLLNISTLVDSEDEENSTAARLITDDLFIGEIIAILIGKQAEERGIRKEDIYDLFDGETLAKAHLAFLEEYKVFFTERGNRTSRDVIAKMEEMMTILATKSAVEEAEEMKKELEKSKAKSPGKKS